MSEDVLLWVGGQLFAAAAIWGGIRMDIKNIHNQLEHMDKSVSDAHNRIDKILLRS